RFFELDSCLSHMLSRYFDDQQSPAECGHCSVCRGQVAKLEYSQQAHWPTDSNLLTNLLGLKKHLAQKTQQVLSIDSYCRFLAGISVPMFSRFKVRQLGGFASCENIRYQDIRHKVTSLWDSIG
ncbi:MAG: recombinase RecQ, partial [Bermanella sp.]